MFGLMLEKGRYSRRETDVAMDSTSMWKALYNSTTYNIILSILFMMV
jgi:hypothetical protein